MIVASLVSTPPPDEQNGALELPEGGVALSPPPSSKPPHGIGMMSARNSVSGHFMIDALISPCLTLLDVCL